MYLNKNVIIGIYPYDPLESNDVENGDFFKHTCETTVWFVYIANNLNNSVKCLMFIPQIST